MQQFFIAGIINEIFSDELQINVGMPTYTIINRFYFVDTASDKII